MQPSTRETASERREPQAGVVPLHVLLNERARGVRRLGATSARAQVLQACEAANFPARVEILPGDRIGKAAERLVAGGVKTLLVGGGDGTLRTAAQVLVDTDVALGVLPLGNRNHFARDLGIPDELGKALQVVAEGHVRKVDVGDLGGTVFLNNSSLGMYPQMVLARDQHQRLRWSRFFAVVRASWSTLARFRLLHVHVHEPPGIGELRTPAVFIGNNEYTLGPGLGRRARLDGGRLFLCAAKPTSRLKFVGLCLRSWVTSEPRPEDLVCTLVESAELTIRRGRTWVAVDGEVLHIHGPLNFRVRAGALRVLAPLSPPLPSSA